MPDGLAIDASVEETFGVAGHWCAGGAGLSFRRTSKGDRYEQRRVAVKAAVGVVEKGAAATVQRAGTVLERAAEMAEEKEAGAGRARRVIRRAAVAAMHRRGSRRSWEPAGPSSVAVGSRRA